MITLTLPYPPTVNHYWKHAVIKGRAQVYISAEGKRYRQSVADTVIQHRERKAPVGRLSINILANMPDRRVRDLDNINKALLDALVHAGVMGDDSLIDKLTVERGPVVKGGQVRVCISQMETNQ